MSTETLQKGMIQAKDGTPGREYLWVNAKGEAGGKTLLVALKDGKAAIKFYVEGYGYKSSKEHLVPGTQLLKLQDGGAQAPVQGKGAAKPTVKPAPTAQAPAKP